MGQNRNQQRRHQRHQIQLMGIQQGNQMELNQQGMQLQKQLWDQTNYEAQVKHMNKAGLGIGLMYGGSGAGGATTGSQTGGSAQGGQAAMGHKTMDVGQVTQAAQAAAKVASEIKLNERQWIK